MSDQNRIESNDLKCLVLDAVGTLIYPDPPVTTVYRETGREFGIELSKDVIEARFNTGYRKFFSQADCSETSEQDEFLRWSELVKFVFCGSHQTGAIFQSLWNHFATPHHWKIFEDVLAFWRAAQARFKKIVIASNFDKRLKLICENIMPLNRADKVFCSSEIGFNKPAKRFYLAIQNHCSLQPNQILMIGDNALNDVDAPRKTGWHARHLDRSQSSLSDLLSENSCTTDSLTNFSD